MKSKKIQKLLVANRGEIAIRVFRAATELHIKTVAIYTHEDRYSLHRYKADEAYCLGAEDEPLKPYLDIEAIITLAKRKKIDAIHPGYGFLSENVTFAKRCEEEGIIFVGPHWTVMEKLGDKIAAKIIARESKVPVIEDSKEDLMNDNILKSEAKRIGYPVMIKAAAGGGGRGMRVVKKEEDIISLRNDASSEALKSFGDGTVFLEKFIENPKHLEVQILGDKHGNLVHLYERDCSVQRRFQKVVEVAPSPSLSKKAKKELYDYALKITSYVNYNNAGTVEFLVDKDENIFFIEVNPRIQVEHTITEEITGIDIVRSQILISAGKKLKSKGIYIKKQKDIKINGFAIQCRITTEDPTNNFQPDYGTIIAYRNAAGMGIRLDEGSSYPGVNISPFFDSMLVKVSASGRSLKGTSARLQRALYEFRIRGVKTNINFLQNVISHPTFLAGKQTVGFIDQHPELFESKWGMNRGTKALRYISKVIVNGNEDINPNKTKNHQDKTFRTPKIPSFDAQAEYPKGTKNLLTEIGPAKFSQWMKDQKQILYTDTTFRDAHQSLLATRVRTKDILAVTESYAKNHPEVFSVEMWGGATFDVCMRFLKEDPWWRLRAIREKMPNILTQMLLRSSNAVGYAAYPDNLVEKFIEKSAENGMDIFRIFDSLNWTKSLEVSTRAVLERTQSLAEVSICYTGNIMDTTKTKFNLEYYIDLAKRIEDMGAHIIAIKDMAGLLNPFAAEKLIKEIKNITDLPIHLHTHDTSGMQVATLMKAIESGVDAIDVATSSMSGLTSQVNFNSLAATMQGQSRECKLNLPKLNEFSNYWEDIREIYYPFESELKSATAQVYEHEIPGGQYSNLRPQARGLGIEDKFELIKENYRLANELFGDIVKVTPSSKVVGDMAMFMTTNDYSKQDILEKGKDISFPDSVINFFKGDLGQPYGGFPKQMSDIVLKDIKPYTERPNAHMKPICFEGDFNAFKKEFGKHKTELDYISYILYPKVYTDFSNFENKYGKVSYIPTKAFFYGMKANEEIIVEIGKGKNLLVKYLNVTEPDDKGYRQVYFKLNGQNRHIKIKDESLKIDSVVNRKANTENEIAVPLQGKLKEVLVKKGDKVEKNTPLFVIEAMKMESTVVAPFAGVVSEVVLNGGMVMSGDLVLVVS